MGFRKKAVGRMLLCVTGMLVFMAGCGKGAESGSGDGTDSGESAAGTVSTYREDVTTIELQAAVAEEFGEDYWPNMDVPQEMLEDTFGISEDMYEEITAQTPMISANVDTLVIVKAKEGSEKQVEDALNAYKEYNTTQALQYPMNMGKVQAAQIKAYGRYICFVQLGAEIPEEDEADSEESDAAAIAHCEKENARALKIIEDMLVK